MPEGALLLGPDTKPVDRQTLAHVIMPEGALLLGPDFGNKIAGRLEPRRPPMTDKGTETAFRLDQCKHFRKSKHLLRSEVNRCDQSSIELHLRRSTSTGE